LKILFILKIKGEELMGLIRKEKKEKQVKIAVSIDAKTNILLTQYSEFLQSSKNHIVNESLNYVIKKDKEFQKLLKAQKEEQKQNITGE
jgi:hypothetical protein